MLTFMSVYLEYEFYRIVLGPLGEAWRNGVVMNVAGRGDIRWELLCT